MRLSKSILAVLLLPLCLLAQPAVSATTGSGHSVSETRSVAPFSAIAVRGAVKLVVRQAGVQAVEVQADDNLLPLIETVVESGPSGPTLKLGVKRGESVRPRSDIVVRVDVVRLERLSASGSGSVRVDGLASPALEFTLSGSADARLAGLSIDRLEIGISGSSDVELAGRAAKFALSIAGSGEVQADKLAADDVSVNIAGSGDARINASRALAVSIAGSGDVVYAGSPALTTSIAGSGSIRRR